ncbi:MAG: lamin tail domain-containing protein [Sedimentisphaerales bacterium]|nr:lamin tail domain-containing protein [Sedimentisphaerales bacterium]
MRKSLVCAFYGFFAGFFLLSFALAVGPSGDLDRNWKVGAGDLALFADQWLDDGGCSEPNCANLDGVGRVNLSDFAKLAENWGADHSGLIISEFMAVNDESLPDEEEAFPDWIEIYNPLDVTVDMEGWYLTDSDSNLTKWAFPAGIELDPGNFLVVFASGNDRRNPANPLHTNFNLNDNDEDVILVTPDGKTIVHSYLAYPQQLGDISYGLMQYSKTLLAEGARVTYQVPSIEDAGADWTAVDFDDSSWSSGATGLSFVLGGAERTSYNDCVYEGGQHIAGNVTTYGIGDGFSGSSSGELIDQSTGDGTGIMVSLSQSGEVSWQASGTGGSDCAAGTDAYETFADFVDMTGVIYYGDPGWRVDMTFSGLDPSTEYTFATSATRDEYSDRWTRYTIMGADTFTNASSTVPPPGVSEVPGLGGSAVRFNTGDNHDQGYVARWTGITASDGTFQVRAEADAENPCSDPRKAYSFDVFMLKGGLSGERISEEMEGINASIRTRCEFYLEEGEKDIFERLSLNIKYEDGFAAYLNGEEVASRNAPSPAEWDSAATADRPIEDASEFETINLTAYAGLLRDGKNVLAIQGLNDNKDDGEFLILPELVGASATGVPQYFTTSTPRTFNVSGAQGIASEVWFSHDRGFYESPFNLVLSTEMAGGEIRYTSNGSRPGISNGKVYTGPIPITKTCTIRAACVKPGYLDSEVETHTYIFVSDVIHQSPSGEKPDANWPNDGTRGQEFEYGMDSYIVNSSSWRYEVDDALLAVPTISVVTDLNHLFYDSGDPVIGGIYVNAYDGHGREWERPTSLELIYPENPQGAGFPDLIEVPDGVGGYRWELPADMKGGFQVDCGIRIRGGWSRHGDNPKHAFRFFFRNEYGGGKLDYPLFGDEGVSKFDKMDLRTAQNYSWSYYNDSTNTMCRDVAARDSQGLMGQGYTRSRYYHLYINGVYWGLFQTQERSEAAFGESYFGGKRENYDTVKAVGYGEYKIETTDGTMDAWRALWDMANLGFENHAVYNRAQGLNPDGTRNSAYPVLLDVDNLIDYMIMVFFDGDRDAPISNFRSNQNPNNWYGIRDRLGDEGFRFFVHDAEHTLSRGLTDRTGPFPAGDIFDYSNPQWIHQELMAHEDYRLRFADHAQKHLIGSGLLTATKAIERFNARANQIDMAIIAESARWGNSSLTKSTWRNAVNTEIYNFFPNRASTIIGQLKVTRLRDGSLAPLYPSIDPPSLSHPGGAVAKNYPLTMSGSGTIYYTLDGSDPRLDISQSLSSSEVTLVSEDSAKSVLVPGVPTGAPTGSILYEYWTGIAGGSVANLTSQPDFPDHPDGGDYLTSFEAPSNWDDNYGARIIGYVHPPTTGSYTFWIATNDFGELWLSTNESESAKVKIASVLGSAAPGEWDKYTSQHSAAKSLVGGQKYYIEARMKESLGDDNMAVTWSGPGVSKGDPIAGTYLSPVTAAWYTSYYDDSEWAHFPSGNSGVGYEKDPTDPVNYSGLIDIDVDSDMYGTNATCYVRIPFTLSAADFIDLTLKVKYDDGFVAYLNGTEVARRNFSGTPAWNSAATSEHADSSACVFEEINISAYLDSLEVGENVLAIQGLNRSASDRDFLISAELAANEPSGGRVSPAADTYGGTITIDHSQVVKARILNGEWSALQEATYAIGSIRESLRITEIMFHPEYTGDPDDPNEEFIELKNISGTSINLNLVKFTNGVDFTFGDINVLGGDYVVVVRNEAAFRAQHPSFSGVIAGQYSGSMENAGERVELCDAIGRPIMDFKYGDGWRSLADGKGYSLTIIDANNPDTSSWGEKDSWRASAYVNGSPGWDDSGIVPNPGDVVINEVLAHSHAEAADWVELYNTTGSAINIGGWYLSDASSDLKKYRIADGASIGAYDYFVLREDANFGPLSSDAGRITGFALSENGDELYLTSAEGSAGSDVLTGYRATEDFGASPTGVSFGRYFKRSTGNYNFVMLDHTTEDSANAYPKVGPVVISEIMYNPESGDQRLEYVELHNLSLTAGVVLYDFNESEPWQFTEGIEYTFPDYPGLTIPPGGYVVIAKDIMAYLGEYGAPGGGTLLLGPYDGKLSNSGEMLELSAPGDVDEEGIRHYFRMERVNYSDGSHPDDTPGGVDLWPMGPDAGGESLTREAMSLYGNDPNNWTGAAPSPGGP